MSVGQSGSRGHPNRTLAPPSISRSGAPDVLVCARGGYVAVDVKHHRTINAGDAVLLTSTLAVPTPTAATPLAGSELRASKDDALQLAHYRFIRAGSAQNVPFRAGVLTAKVRPTRHPENSPLCLLVVSTHAGSATTAPLTAGVPTGTGRPTHNETHLLANP